jgi:hypothetical protein
MNIHGKRTDLNCVVRATFTRLSGNSSPVRDTAKDADQSACDTAHAHALHSGAQAASSGASGACSGAFFAGAAVAPDPGTLVHTRNIISGRKRPNESAKNEKMK